MAVKRMTKGEVPRTFGAFKPVGHVVMAFSPSDGARRAMEALQQACFEEEDVLHYGADEEAETMGWLLDTAPGTIEFGHEAVLMRRYRELADEGCEWLIVFAPEDEQAERVAEIAKRCGARVAERYHRLAVQDLL